MSKNQDQLAIKTPLASQTLLSVSLAARPKVIETNMTANVLEIRLPPDITLDSFTRISIGCANPVGNST
jgi:hypothetical protein